MNNALIDKLRKLIAHEKSARAIGSLAEAEAFAAKIQDLLTEHKLGMDEVTYAEREASEPVDWCRVSTDEAEGAQKNFRAYWQQALANAIAEVNGCEVVGHGSGGKSFSFVGRTSDRELCKVLWIYLIELGEELCARNAEEEKDDQYFKFRDEKGFMFGNGKMPAWAPVAFRAWMKDYRKSWRVGYADAICKRFLDNFHKAMKKAEHGAAMVHIKKDALAVEAFLKGKTRYHAGSVRGGSNEDGYARGKSVGSAVNLTPNRFKPAPSGKVIGFLPPSSGWRDKTGKD